MSTNAIQCYDCSETSLVGEGQGEDFVECPFCYGDNTQAVIATPCTGGDQCRDDDHHYGLNMHVAEIDR